MNEQTITINSSQVSRELVELFEATNFQHWDDTEHTRTRDAVYGQTIIPTPIKDGAEPAEGEEDTRETVGWKFSCIVPEDFVAPEGVTIDEA
jgi:hypothetical protein